MAMAHYSEWDEGDEIVPGPTPLERAMGELTHLREFLNNGLFNCSADTRSTPDICGKVMKLPTRREKNAARVNWGGCV